MGAILGNLLSIKPILYFNDQGVIEVYEKVRTEKKATKRLIEIIKETTAYTNTVSLSFTEMLPKRLKNCVSTWLSQA